MTIENTPEMTDDETGSMTGCERPEKLRQKRGE
jgi:hypothetical protein